MKIKYLLASVLLLASGSFAYSEIAKSNQCSKGQSVKINLTSKRETTPYRLEVPCEYFSDAYRSLHRILKSTDGDHESIQLSFFKDTLKPVRPWHEQNPDEKHWPENEIRLRISRSSNPDMIEETRKAEAPYKKQVTDQEVTEEIKKFYTYVSTHGSYPKSPYTLYPKNIAKQTRIDCVHSGQGCGIYEARTYYKGLGLNYRFHNTLLAQWESIENESKELLDQFIVNKGAAQ